MANMANTDTEQLQLANPRSDLGSMETGCDSDYMSSPVDHPSSSDDSSSARSDKSRVEEFGSFTRKRRASKRTLKVEYWDRDAETKERKEKHTHALDENPQFESREDFILATILAGKEFHLEPNMFPYDCPPGIEHWTLWSREYLSHDVIDDIVEEWLETNLPTCVAWEYEDNGGSRSFDIEHVHVYFQLKTDDQPTSSRKRKFGPTAEASTQ
eukprot:TRINITY_DN1408_c0_g1_i1.p1 TRINITY_DN1408_c0_g1~~TRINITY_DN1408_c0_g1_i1.p1  ORF type:complete len:213 (-),score=24.45 TRINITY_DN1408_c0_g1_i1:584-1222(-)